ncbi:MAG: hypothetical protein AB3N18_09660, partial [Allomuricauda sp.]
MKGVLIFVDEISSKQRAKTNPKGHFIFKSTVKPKTLVARSPLYGDKTIKYSPENIITFEKVDVTERIATKKDSKKPKP